MRSMSDLKKTCWTPERRYLFCQNMVNICDNQVLTWESIALKAEKLLEQRRMRPGIVLSFGLSKKNLEMSSMEDRKSKSETKAEASSGSNAEVENPRPASPQRDDARANEGNGNGPRNPEAPQAGAENQNQEGGVIAGDRRGIVHRIGRMIKVLVVLLLMDVDWHLYYYFGVFSLFYLVGLVDLVYESLTSTVRARPPLSAQLTRLRHLKEAQLREEERALQEPEGEPSEESLADRRLIQQNLLVPRRRRWWWIRVAYQGPYMYVMTLLPNWAPEPDMLT